MKRVAASLVAGALAAGLSCRTPTEIMVEVRTDLEPKRVRGVTFYVAADPRTTEEQLRHGFEAAATRSVQPDGFIGTLGIVPGGDRVSIVVTASVDGESPCGPPDYAGCIVARRTVAFVAHEITHLPITLYAECLNTPCSAETTCTGGACVSSEVACNGDSCQSPAEPADGGVVLVDATTPVLDAAVDAAEAAAPPTRRSAPGIVCPPDLVCGIGSACCYDTAKAAGRCGQCTVAGANIRVIACDDRSDCNATEVCCGAAASGTSCSSAPCPEVVVCNDDTDCPKGKCAPRKLFDAYGICQ